MYTHLLVNIMTLIQLCAFVGLNCNFCNTAALALDGVVVNATPRPL